jgi:hypothetical protein
MPPPWRKSNATCSKPEEFQGSLPTIAEIEAEMAGELLPD